jgi:hypothetical protein
MPTLMTVSEVIQRLMAYPPELPVRMVGGSVIGVKQGLDGERVVVELVTVPDESRHEESIVKPAERLAAAITKKPLRKS